MNEPTHPRGIMWGGEVAIPWQTGPVTEVGVNGIQADNVLEQVQRYLEAVGAPPYQNHHTDGAIECIANAISELRARTHERVAAGTEGTSQP